VGFHLTQNITHKDQDQDQNPTISLTHLTQNNTHKDKDQDENPTISLTHIIVCPFVLFLLAIAMYVLRFTDYDCPFGYFKLFGR
jgi:hypothetical protein